MKSTKRDYLILFFGGCILGIISFIFVYGYRVLDFTYDAWLLQGTGYSGDLTQHYLGWVFLRDSKWSFPLGLIDGLAYPNKISVIYTDSIPLFAFIFKILSPILPKTFQYFGLWGVICFALQGGISAIIIKKFTNSKAVCLISSLFFIFSPIVFKRMFFHTALAAHWIILLAICIWIYSDHFQSLKRKLLVWCGLIFLCVVSNLYFTPLVMGIMLCSFVQDFIKTKKFVDSIIVFVCTIATTFIFMFIFGGFYGGVSTKMSGLGTFSLNLNGLYNPLGNSYFLSSHPLANAGQVEGFSYLGLGMLFLFVIALFIKLLNITPSKSLKEKFLEILPYGIAIVVFTLLAISPVITINNTTLVSIKFPKFIMDILSIFRSSGRFIWPVYYMIFIFAISTIVKLNKNTVSVIVLSTFLIIQLMDIKDMIANNRNFFINEKVYTSTLKSEKWDEFAKKYNHIMFYEPLWEIYKNADIAYNFAVYAHNNGMTLNGTYFSRDLSKQIDEITLQHFEELKKENIPDDTLYIFTTKIPSGDYGLKYYDIDGYKVGVRVK